MSMYLFFSKKVRKSVPTEKMLENFISLVLDTN